MFDWPEASQTSPMRTSFIVMALLVPFTVRACGSDEASSFSSRSVHLPEASALTVFDWPERVIVTGSLGSAQPQTAVAESACRTMCSEKTAGRRTCAGVVTGQKRRDA